MDKSEEIFGNTMPEKVIRRAERSKQKYISRFGDDSEREYYLGVRENAVIGGSLGVRDLFLADKAGELADNAVIIGNIRMGFGHYRISMAMASCVHALGYTPYWLDLCSLKGTVCEKTINSQNELYSLGSRLSQKIKLFDRFIWEPMNYEGFKKLSYNAVDQKTAELLSPPLRNLPHDIPFVATHVWPAQAAVHAGLCNVVNAIPDNWPMALHLAEGARHTVQTPSAYLGYKALREMAPGVLRPMPDGSLFYTGHYVDHELVSNIEQDCARRRKRAAGKVPMRFLLSVGGAGAQIELFIQIINRLLPSVASGKAALLVNVGDHKNVWEQICRAIPALTGDGMTTAHFDDFAETSSFALSALDGEMTGVHAFYHEDIFAAVYSTNLLMRACDVLITKPSELSFYPVPKLMIHRVGGHEKWGAVRAAEVGDGTYECDTAADVYSMLDLMQNDPQTVADMCKHICKNGKNGLYDGAYNVIRLAVGDSLPM